MQATGAEIVHGSGHAVEFADLEERRRALENEMREAKNFILAYVERVEQLCKMEAEARKAMEFWRGEAERLAQERPRYLKRAGHYLSKLKNRLVALRSHR